MYDLKRFEQKFSPVPFRVAICLSTGNEHTFGTRQSVTEGKPWDVMIVSKSHRADRCLKRLMLRKILEAYVEGEIDVEGDFRYFAQLRLHARQPERMITVKDMLDFLIYRTISSNPITESLAVRHHYDQPIEFVEGYLDRIVRAHSCCVFGDPLEDPTESTISLEEAAVNRERLVAEKLKPAGKSVLDIGCGSGYFVNLVVKEFGARQAYGVTLSENQKYDADRLFEQSGTVGRCKVEIKNYREVTGQFDCINSVGMVSHIGRGMLEFYWKKVASLLKPNGLYHHHCFMHYDGDNQLNDALPLFSRDQVWPNYQWYRLDEHIKAAEKNRFEITDIKCLRLHYARTIDHWYERFLNSMPENRKLVSDKTIRAWKAYLANMAIGFRNREFTVNQLLCTRLEKKIVPVVANLKASEDTAPEKHKGFTKTTYQ
jgi:cyclopropane-fatty-acyl-phospholipid synthase